MDRTIPFDEHAVCDICGEQGAFDYMGDCICSRCIEPLVPLEKSFTKNVKFKKPTKMEF